MRWPWRRRTADAAAQQPHGRHMRVDGATAPSVVPAAAAAVAPPVEVVVSPPPAPAAPPAPVPVAAGPVPDALPVPTPPVAPVAPIVSLGFADGESVALADDDPRVGSFRAAAAAVLGETTATPRS